MQNLNPGLADSRLDTIQPSATLQATLAAQKMRAEGIDVLNLAAGEPDMGTPAVILQATKKALDDGYTRYTSARGDAKLIEAIQSKMKRDYAIAYASDELIATVGAKGAISLALDAVIEPGDEVILCAPYWVTYADVVRLAGGVPVVVSSTIESGFLPQIDDIQAAISARTKMIIVNSPNNPTGRIWPKHLLRQIADLSIEHDFWVMSDDIYERVYFQEEPPQLLIDIAPEIKSRLIIINGVAKAYAMTGYRIGWACGPKELIDGMYKLQQQRLSHPASMAQIASAYAIEEDASVQAEMDMMRETFRRRRDQVLPILNKHPLLKVIEPEGAFYAFVQVDETVTRRLPSGERISDALLNEAHVSVVPGEAFGVEGAFRLSFAVSDAVLTQGVDRIITYLNTHMR